MSGGAPNASNLWEDRNAPRKQVTSYIPSDLFRGVDDHIRRVIFRVFASCYRRVAVAIDPGIIMLGK
jgi:hypothetical protein